jgi:hypothetical protein
LTLTHYSRDEDLESQEVRLCFEVEPLQAWYYDIFSNFHTLVILVQVELAFNDEPKTICKGFYEILDTSIFAWFLVFDVGHYCWLCDPIHPLPFNNKAKYLVCTIRHILDFLQL